MDGSTDQTERETITLALLAQKVGSHGGISDWICVDQPMIDAFAAATGDDAFIHVDPERAAKTRFHGTIAHGLLVLSLLPKLMRTATAKIEDVKMGVNYGFDKVRFIHPVAVNSRVRGQFNLVELIELKPRFFRSAYEVNVEIEGQDRPALSAHWMLGHWAA